MTPRFLDSAVSSWEITCHPCLGQRKCLGLTNSCPFGLSPPPRSGVNSVEGPLQFLTADWDLFVAGVEVVGFTRSSVLPCVTQERR